MQFTVKRANGVSQFAKPLCVFRCRNDLCLKHFKYVKLICSADSHADMNVRIPQAADEMHSHLSADGQESATWTSGRAPYQLLSCEERRDSTQKGHRVYRGT